MSWHSPHIHHWFCLELNFPEMQDQYSYTHSLCTCLVNVLGLNSKLTRAVTLNGRNIEVTFSGKTELWRDSVQNRGWVLESGLDVLSRKRMQPLGIWLLPWSKTPCGLPLYYIVYFNSSLSWVKLYLKKSEPHWIWREDMDTEPHSTEGHLHWKCPPQSYRVCSVQLAHNTGDHQCALSTWVTGLSGREEDTTHRHSMVQIILEVANLIVYFSLPLSPSDLYFTFSI